MKHIVDIETWERKDNYNFFRGFANSWIAITSEVDCTEAYNHAKTNGKSFFSVLSLCHIARCQRDKRVPLSLG